jgi:hypothetical protein
MLVQLCAHVLGGTAHFITILFSESPFVQSAQRYTRSQLFNTVELS